jgi:hypothetical protein
MSTSVTNQLSERERRPKDCSEQDFTDVTSVGFTRTAAAIAVAVLMTVARTPASAVIDDSLLVRIYDNVGVARSDLATAFRTAQDILRRADLSVDWVQCRARRDGPVPGVCDQPLSSGDVVVRLIEGSDKETGERRALGYSLFDSNGVSGFATVYVDRVDWLAKRAQYPVAPVLGRAIAHEIGHLILRSNAHTETGLMREVWTAEQIVKNRREDWTFSPDQGGDLRNARLVMLSNARKARRPRT